MKTKLAIFVLLLSFGLSGCFKEGDVAIIMNFQGRIVGLTKIEEKCLVIVQTDNNSVVGVLKRNLNYCHELQEGDKVRLSLLIQSSVYVPGNLEKIK